MWRRTWRRCLSLLRCRLQRRLRRDACDLPSEQRTRWDQKLQRVARTVRGCEPHQPHSVTRQGRWQRPRSRSGSRRKPSDQAGHGRAFDGKTRGATLIEQEGAARTTGSGLGQRGTEVREARGRPRGGDRDHGLRRRLQKSLNAMRNRGIQGSQGGQLSSQPQPGTRPRDETERVKRLRTDTSARLRGDTVKIKRRARRGRTNQHRRERAQGPRQELG